jgi:superfamily II DNA or RNA helicase
MMNLRPHQDKLIEDIRTAFKTHKSVLAVAPVGFGKTIISAYMGKRIIDKKNSMFFCVHTRDLITQTHKAFDKFSIPYGFIAAGYYSNKYPIQICSINTLKNRLHKAPIPTMLVIDEAHIGGPSWAKMINFYKEKGCFILGLTASPWKLNSQGLGEYFDTIVEGPTTKWLIDNKYLSNYRIFAPSKPDLSKSHTRMGDYVQEELEAIMDTPQITGCAISHWKKYAQGKRTIIFCTSIKHSKDITKQFNEAGISTEHLDGECTKEQRAETIRKLADGEILCISNCYLFTAGFDLSLQIDRDITIEAIVLLRPTQSLSLNIQMNGRVLRYKDYPALILDHANQTATHGLPCQDRKWTLSGITKKKSSEPNLSVKVCPSCYACIPSAKRECPECQHIFEIQYREVKQTDGELTELNIEATRKHNEQVFKTDQASELWRAQTREQLVDLAKRRGYKNPWGFAHLILQKRQAKKIYENNNALHTQV